MKERKPDRNQVVKEDAQRRFAVISEVKRLAEQIPNQDALDAILAQKDNIAERKQLFNFLSKFIRNFRPEFLTKERQERVIVEPKMIVRPN